MDQKQEELFILTGHRKSGTSMFHRLFDGHPDINLYPVDLSILYAYFPCFTSDLNYPEKELRIRLKKVLKQSLESQDIRRYKEKVNEFIRSVDESLNDNQLRNKISVIKTIKNSWVNVTGSNDSLPFVFKETSQAIFFHEFKKQIPDLKMVTLIRDPRDNYAALKAGVSHYYSKIGENEKETLASLINRVRMDLKAAELNQKKYPESFISIKFEDLVINPKQVMNKVSRFLGISFSETLLNPTIMGRPYKGNSHNGKVFSGISSENIGKWKERISKDEAMVIEYWLKDVMDFWGYSLEYDDLEKQKAFSSFYEWYNCKYFYHDTFK